MATGSGTGAALYWVRGNHMGVPITNASGSVASPPAYTMAGFPGQTKTLSDIYYNRYRDYDSSTGRYIQADPIGLEGGDNPFLYANANPLKDFDPLGLSATAALLPQPVLRLCPECAAFVVLAPFAWKAGEIAGDFIGDCILWAQRGGQNKGERGYTGKPDKPDKKMKPVPGRPGWGQEKNPQTGKKGPPKPWPNDPRLK